MKLSFVIPAYNEEVYLKYCLESIFKEADGKNYDLEIIVVNNASTDNTENVALSFKNVKLVNEPSKGLVHARKAGYMASSGDLIANVDSDTTLPPGWIDKVFKEFKNEKLVGLSGPFVINDLTPFWRFGVWLFYEAGFLIYFLYRHIFRKGSVLQGGNFVLRRSAFEKIGGFNDKFDFYGEDSDVAKRISKVGETKFTSSFPIYTTGRRMATEGPFTMGLKYGLNFFWVTFFNKPFSKKSIDVRYSERVGKLKIRPQNWPLEIFSAVVVSGVVLGIPVTLAYLAYSFLSQL